MIRFSPSRFALSYIALAVLALALFAIPLWYGYRANLGTFRAYVPGAEMQRLVDIFHRDGPQAAAAAVESYLPSMPRDEVLIFVDPQKRRLAGTLPAWPAEVPEVPGTYGLVIGLGADASMRVVTSHVTLPGGYQLLMGRESVRFDSLVARFWSGIAGAVAIVLTLGLAFAWLLRRERGQLEALVAQRTAALRLSEERYARAMEGSDAGHWDWNIVTDEMFVSERAREMLALPAGELPATRADIMALVPQHPDDRRAMHERVRVGIGTGSFERDYRVMPRPGEVRWLHSRAKVYKDARGAAVRMTGSLTDITERKLAEALLAGEKRILELITRRGPLDTVLDAICRVFDELWPALRSSVTLLGARGERLRLVAAPHLPAPFVERMADLPVAGPDSGLCGLAVSRGVPVIAQDLRADPAWARFRELYAAHELAACWSVPFMSEAGKPLGTFAVFPSEPRGPSARELGAIERFGHLAAIAVERKRTEEELKRSEERYGLAMDASEEGHFDWNVKTDEIFVSAHIKMVFGLPLDAEFRIRNDLIARIAYHPDDRPWLDEMVRATLAGTALAHEFEYRILREGEVRWLRTRWKIFRDESGAALRVIGVVNDITERKRAADALKRSEERFALAVAGSNDGLWDWDILTNEMFLSERAQRIYGLEPGHAIRPRAEWRALVKIHPDDAEGQLRSVEDYLAGKSANYEGEWRVLHPDGRYRWIRIRGTCVRDAEGRPTRFAGSVSDIDVRRRAEEALRRSESYLTEALRLGRAGSFAYDARAHQQVHWSRTTYEIFDFDPARGLPAPEEVYRRVHPEDVERVREARGKAMSGKADYDAHYRIVRRDGTIRHLHATGHPALDANGEVVELIGVVTDVTERKRAEEEVRRMERQLRQAQRLEAMGTLAGGIAHDFNNILGAILGYGEMALRDAAKGSRLRRDLDSIMTAGERGRALVDRVLAFSRSGVGERVAVPVEKVVREALDLVSAKLPPNVTLHAKLHTGSAAMLGDPTQVHQVLMNLATNAVQAMPAGGTLRVSLDTQHVDAARATTIGSLAPADYVVLKVADTGTGIAPDILERIFDPFFTTKEVGTGTGLGLSLVHGIVSEVGGAIDVASKVGAGSAFTVYLPRSGDALDSLQGAQPELPRGDGQRVLVVDDEEPLVQLATRTLEELGYAPIGFTSSAAALAAFRADPQRFDAVITDERMPGMSGSALIREVRGLRNGIPIVLMSGYVGGAVASRAREAGAEEVLKKPLSARDLAASLARVLHSRAPSP